MLETSEGPVRAVLVAVQLPDVDDVAFRSSVTELGRLARTLGLEVAATLTQRRPALHAGTVIGSGKLVELQRLLGGARDDAEGEDGEEDGDGDGYQDEDRDELENAGEGGGESRVEGAPANVVLVDHELTPSQARNLERLTGVEVLDRTAVILEIFRRHSRSRAAKAQVEIVRLQYLVPRLREQGKGRDRQRGGIGGKGAGESSLELDRRKIRDRIAELGREIAAMAEEQRTQPARPRDLPRAAQRRY